MSTTTSNDLPVTQKEFYEFMEKMDAQYANRPDLVAHYIKGTEAFRKHHDAHYLAVLESNDTHTKPVSVEQHPPLGASCDSASNVSDFIMHKPVGDCLVLSTPGNIWMTPSQAVYEEAAEFLTLLKVKHIPQALSLTNSNNPTMQLLARAPITSKDRNIDKAVRSQIEEFLPLYNELSLQARNNFSTYAKKGIHFKGTKEARLQQAFAFEIAKLNRAVSMREKSFAPALCVIDNDHTNERFVMVPNESGSETYVKIPDLRGPNKQKELETFITSLPNSEEWQSEATHNHIGYNLSEAYNRFLDKKDVAATKKKLVASSSCTDSRTAPVPTIFGENPDFDIYNFQVPGSNLTGGDGKLSTEGGIFVGMVKYLGIKDFTHTHHTECGLLKAVCSFGKSPESMKGLPAFHTAGEEYNDAYSYAMEKGIEHYAKKSVKIVGDEATKQATMLAMGRLMQDRKALIDKGVNPFTLLQDTAGVLTYAYRPEHKDYLQLPQKQSEVLSLYVRPDNKTHLQFKKAHSNG